MPSWAVFNLEAHQLTKKSEGIFLIAALLLTTLLIIYSYKHVDTFWYTYTFTLLIGMALAFSIGEVMDRLSFWRYFLIGLSLGVVGYIITKLTYICLPYISAHAFNNVNDLLNTYSPNNIWQIALLITIIVAGEEMLWRAYIQQALKKFVTTNLAILLTSVHFSLGLLFCGYYIGAIAAFLSSLVFGYIYEWLKSLPLLIVAHLTMIALLFLLLPLT